jgi:hypothetical protein
MVLYFGILLFLGSDHIDVKSNYHYSLLLLYRMLMKSEDEDDYNNHLQKMKIKLLDWQIKSKK